MPHFKYPKEQGYDNGCKVGWMFYADRADAEEAATVARAEAKYKAGLGFDFGYQTPGEIKEVNGQFRVTVP